MTNDVERLISGEEGFRPRVYDDATGLDIVPGYTVKGHPTVGYGRALDRNGITEPEGAFLRQGDILRVRTELSAAYPWFGPLDGPRQAVVISMAYNMGVDGFGSFHDTIAAIAAGDYARAAAEMRDSAWARQVPARVEELVRIMSTGSF